MKVLVLVRINIVKTVVVRLLVHAGELTRLNMIDNRLCLPFRCNTAPIKPPLNLEQSYVAWTTIVLGYILRKVRLLVSPACLQIEVG